MISDQYLRSTLPTDLGAARAFAHRAAQLVTMAARANLPPVSDDSHSNLGWDPITQSLVSHPLQAHGAGAQVSLSLSTLQIGLNSNGQHAESLKLDGRSHADALGWLDDQLVRAGFHAASNSALPYELPTDVASITKYNAADFDAQLASLAAWFDTANQVLSDFASSLTDLDPGASAVRCWPHHFDIATYVGLEQGAPETARGIGIGMAPGDESYDQPYFYVNPWPHLDPVGLPPAPAPGHWHQDGFVGAIATAEEILKLSDIRGELPKFIAMAFGIGRSQLGA